MKQLGLEALVFVVSLDLVKEEVAYPFVHLPLLVVRLKS